MGDRRDVLLEVGTEELPPRALTALSAALAHGLETALREAGLDPGAAEPFATPRRLAVRLRSVSDCQPDRDLERRGPPVSVAFDAGGQPTRAALAFAESCGVELSALERVDTPKGQWLIHRAREPGRPARELLPALVAAVLSQLPVPRRMRWGEGDVEFVRPVHWLVLLFGEESIETPLLGVHSDRFTRGHRFHAPQPLRVTAPAAYAELLESEGRVIADFARRRERISRLVLEAAAAAGGEASMEDPLLDEVTALVEWPVALAGKFDPRFLELPPEVLVATLQGHQRYFPVHDGQGHLMPCFVAVSNIESTDPDEVRRGNERVVRPRLADAAFFWETDRKQRLEQRVELLDRVVFQDQLGTLGDKTRRIVALARHVAAVIGSDVSTAARAAVLAKTDLLTDMVGEFPELQGVMGQHYALHDQEPEAVATAIGEQYWPRFAGDRLPATPAGRALAIADKVDTIVGIFAIGNRPSGTKDPFGLRRSAIGVLRIVIECELPLDLVELLRMSAEALPVAVDPDDSSARVYDFMMERLRAYYLDAAAAADGGLDSSLFDAVLVKRPAQPLDFDRRLHAVERFMQLEAAESLAAANKRIVNILRQAEDAVPDEVMSERLVEPAEKALLAQLEAVRPEVRRLLAAQGYRAALEKLAELRDAVDAFFEEVMVMSDDAALRRNRLALLRQLEELFSHTADLSRLQPAPRR